MNILMLSSNMQNGGAETHILCLCRSLLCRGHRITLVSSGGAVVDVLKREGVRCITLPLTTITPIGAVRAVSSLLQLVSKGKFDVIHAHTRVSALYADIVARVLAKPLVVTLHAHFNMRGVRGILTRTGDRCIAVSEDIARHIQGVERAQRTRCVRVIPNGVDTNFFVPDRKTKNTLRVIFVSRLDGDCSRAAHILCDIAPALARKLPTLDIVIAGGGSEYERICERAEKINAAYGRVLVRAVGHKEDIPPLLQSADVLVGVSRAALEGMSCALPVVLCGDEGYLGLLDSREKMRIAERTNFCCRGCKRITSEALLHELLAVLTADREKRKKLGEFSREYVVKYHSAVLMAKMTEKEYKLARKNALLCGYYGYGNLGDEALLSFSKERAQKIWGEGNVSVLTKKASAPREYTRMSPRSIALALRGSDTLILGGGTLLQTDTSHRSLWYYISLIFFARALGRRVLIWGNGLQEVDGVLAKKTLAWALSECSYIGVRDKQSADIAKDMGVPAKKIHLEGDLAAKTAAVDRVAVQKILFKMGIEAGQKYVIVAAKGSYSPQLCELLQCIKKAKGQKILPVYVAMYPREDVQLAFALKNTLGGVCAPLLKPCELVGLMKGAECVFASRYHAAVFADAANVPVYIFGNEEKLGRLLPLKKESK